MRNKLILPTSLLIVALKRAHQLIWEIDNLQNELLTNNGKSQKVVFASVHSAKTLNEILAHAEEVLAVARLEESLLSIAEVREALKIFLTRIITLVDDDQYIRITGQNMDKIRNPTQISAPPQGTGWGGTGGDSGGDGGTGGDSGTGNVVNSG